MDDPEAAARRRRRWRRRGRPARTAGCAGACRPASRGSMIPLDSALVLGYGPERFEDPLSADMDVARLGNLLGGGDKNVAWIAIWLGSGNHRQRGGDAVRRGAGCNSTPDKPKATTAPLPGTPSLANSNGTPASTYGTPGTYATPGQYNNLPGTTPRPTSALPSSTFPSTAPNSLGNSGSVGTYPSTPSSTYPNSGLNTPTSMNGVMPGSAPVNATRTSSPSTYNMTSPGGYNMPAIPGPNPGDMTPAQANAAWANQNYPRSAVQGGSCRRAARFLRPAADCEYKPRTTSGTVVWREQSARPNHSIFREGLLPWSFLLLTMPLRDYTSEPNSPSFAPVLVVGASARAARAVAGPRGTSGHGHRSVCRSLSRGLPARGSARRELIRMRFPISLRKCPRTRDLHGRSGEPPSGRRETCRATPPLGQSALGASSGSAIPTYSKAWIEDPFGVLRSSRQDDLRPIQADGGGSRSALPRVTAFASQPRAKSLWQVITYRSSSKAVPSQRRSSARENGGSTPTTPICSASPPSLSEKLGCSMPGRSLIAATWAL